jgi:hypothetical protein
MKPRFVPLIGLWVAASLTAAPNSLTIKEVGLHIDAHSSGNTIYHGYSAHRFTVLNNGSLPRKVTFTLPARPSIEDFRVNTITRTFTVMPGPNPLTLYQPPLPLSSWNKNVRVECEGNVGIIEAGWDNRLDTPQNSGYQRNLVVHLARSQNQTALEGTQAPVSGSDTRFVEYFTSPEEIENWPGHWLAYSGYDAIVLTEAEWGRASQGTKDALRRWSMAGGHMVMVGDPFLGQGDSVAGLSEKFSATGFGNIVGLKSAGKPGDPNAVLGRIVEQLYAGDMPRKNQPAIPMVAGIRRGVEEYHNEDVPEYMGFGHHNEGEGGFNRFFQVVEGAQAPVGLVILVLTVFVLLAGPVNLIILSKKGKRAWFLWTLPAISFATSGLVFLVAFFGEGVRPKIRIDTVTVLDQGTQEATTVGGVAIYAPVAPSKLEFGGNTEVTPLVDRKSSDSGSGRRVEWQDGGSQVFTGKWVASRIPAHFALRKSEHREERVKVDWTGEKPMLLNGLGVELDRIYLYGQDGTLYSGKDIPAGSQVPLSEDQSGRTDKSLPVRTALWQILDGHLEEPHRLAGKNSYYAKYSAPSPFVENPLGKKSANETHNGVLIGIFGGEVTQ